MSISGNNLPLGRRYSPAKKFCTSWEPDTDSLHFGRCPFGNNTSVSVRFGIPQRTRIHARKMHRQAVITNRWKTVLKPVCIPVIRNFICSWTKNEFHFQPDWYRGIEYRKNRNEVTILMKTCMSRLFWSGYKERWKYCFWRVSQKFPAAKADILRLRQKTVLPRDSFITVLKIPAHQFHNKREGEHYILAGYPWF